MAQQQKAHYPREQTKTLFCAKTCCRDITRFLPCGKTCYTPSSSCAKRSKWKFFPQWRILPLGLRGHSSWPYPFQSYLAAATLYSSTLNILIVIISLWWQSRNQWYWPFPCYHPNICSNCYSPSWMFFFIIFNFFASLFPRWQHRFASRTCFHSCSC